MNLSNIVRSGALSLFLGWNLTAAEGPSLEVISRPLDVRPRSFGDSGELELSENGQWAVFTSSGNGLATNDHNGFNLDVFLRNNETGEITLVSKALGGKGSGGNGNSYGPSVRVGGRYVLFESEASDLVAGDTNGVSDVFQFDRTTGQVSIVSTNLQGGVLDGTSGAPVTKLETFIILFETLAGLSPLDMNDSVDLYRVTSGAGIDLVSVRSNSLEAANGPFATSTIGSFEASVSGAFGRYVAFVSSATNHVPGVPANAAPQIYLRDMEAGTNVWLTRSMNGAGATSVSSPEVDLYGAFVLFLSSSILPTATTPPANSLFLYAYEIESGERRLVTPGLVPVEQFSLSMDSRWVAYASSNQVYLRDLAGTTNILVSRSVDGGLASGISTDPAISDLGRYVVFTSTATNLTGSPTDELLQTYRFDRETGEVVLMSRAAAPEVGGADEDTLFPVISADGSMIGFHSYAGNVVTNDNPLSNDVFIVPNNATGAVVLASSPHPASVQGTGSGASFVENQAISLDGRFVVFSSDADDLVEGDEDEARDLFLRDRAAGTTELVSFLPDGSAQTEAVTFASASRDAGRIAYSVTETTANTLFRSAYVYDRGTGSNTLVSLMPTGEATNTVGPMLLSPGGRYFVFRTEAVSGPIYIRDLGSNVTTQYNWVNQSGRELVAISPGEKFLLTKNTANSFALHDLEARRFLTNISTLHLASDWFTIDEDVILTEVPLPSVSQPTLMLRALDGSVTNAIATNATALAMSSDGSAIAYRQREGTNFTYLIYKPADGSYSPIVHDGTNLAARVRSATFNADGRYLAIVTTNTLVGSVDHSFNKINVYDTVLKMFRAAGLNAAGEEAEFGLGNPSISANGSVVVFDTFAANLATNDLNIASDVFVSRFAPVDSDADGLEDGWETIHFDGLTLNGSADSDFDGVSDRDEFVAGTDPNSASSRLVLTTERMEDGETLVITAPASFGRSYVLEFMDDLAADEWEIASEPQVVLRESVTFEAPIAEGNRFYRVRPMD